MMLPCWMAGGYPVPCRERMFPTMVRGSVDGTTLAGSRLRIGPIRRSTPTETRATSLRLQRVTNLPCQRSLPWPKRKYHTSRTQPCKDNLRGCSENRSRRTNGAPTSRSEPGRQSRQRCRAPRVLEDIPRPEAVHERLPMEQVDPVFGSVQWVIADQIVIADQWVLPASGFGLQDAQ